VLQVFRYTERSQKRDPSLSLSLSLLTASVGVDGAKQDSLRLLISVLHSVVVHQFSVHGNLEPSLSLVRVGQTVSRFVRHFKEIALISVEALFVHLVFIIVQLSFFDLFNHRSLVFLDHIQVVCFGVAVALYFYFHKDFSIAISA